MCQNKMHESQVHRTDTGMLLVTRLCNLITWLAITASTRLEFLVRSFLILFLMCLEVRLMLTAPKFANLMLRRVAIMPGMSPKIANPCTADVAHYI